MSNDRIWLSHRGWFRAVALASLIVAGGTYSAAGANTQAAETVVQELVADIRSGLDLPSVDQRLARLTTVIEANTDVDLLSRLALGRYWRQLGDRQQHDYQNLFRTVILGSFARRLENYTKDIDGPLEEQFKITGSKAAGRSDILVRSQIQPPSGPTLAVDWRLRDNAIIDLIVEGVSLLITQRAEFAAVIERSDVDGLIENLRKKAGQPNS